MTRCTLLASTAGLLMSATLASAQALPGEPVYVSARFGNDDAPGTRMFPKRTLAGAAASAGGVRPIYADLGRYEEAIPQGIKLLGGFDAENGWPRDPASFVTTLANAGVLADASGVVIDGVDFAGLTIDASTRSTQGLGLLQPQDVFISNSRFIAGNAASGVDGLVGEPGRAGGAGAAGGAGCESSSGAGCGGCSAPLGGGGGSGFPHRGGTGGAAGRAFEFGQTGAAGEGPGGGAGGAGIQFGLGNWCPSDGFLGRHGAAGITGGAGQPGLTLPLTTDGVFRPLGTEFTRGLRGSGGSGGGGGGGGGGGIAGCDSYGGRGGGGGGGGEGGQGGGGGGGGGGSIGLVISGIPGTVDLVGCRFITGRASDGGDGAPGGPGGAGGPGAVVGCTAGNPYGGATGQDDGSNGGRGGNGGPGGPGGDGAGGAGGPSIGVLLVQLAGATNDVGVADASFSLSTAGAGGLGHRSAPSGPDGVRQEIAGSGGTRAAAIPMDCNANGVHDLVDVADGTSLDLNLDNIPDECQTPPCPADLDGDGALTIFDFLSFQNLFDAGDPAADFDGDGSMTIFDFLAFQNAFDAGC